MHDQANLEIVAETKAVRVLRAREGGGAVLLRRSVKEYPTPGDLAQLKYGAEIAGGLDLPGVLKVLETRREERALTIVHEDPGGTTLRVLLDGGPLGLDQAHPAPLPIEQALAIAVQISRALGELHQRRIVHKDIEPQNIFVAGGLVKLTGFDVASRLDREMAAPASPDRLEGNLVYISPEQTGRMNRAIDYRSDFYSLGVVLTEMLTGRPPFESPDPMALVHAHIALPPRPLHESNPAVPLSLSRIVARLLAKNAEDRYQSAYGLTADLLECEAMMRGVTRDDFVPGGRDVSAIFRLPQKLYGRDAERAALIDAFERAAHGKLTLAVVAGYSGIGKSALVNELQRPVVERRGYFVSGKYDQLQNAPYRAVISALQDLVRQILTESEPVIASWRGRLADALGATGQVVVDVIPDVARIIGPQPPVPPLGPTESQNRFNLIFQQFIAALATEDHPLAVFLDDLQWADSGSLNLLQLLAKGDVVKNTLVVGAYRDNEVGEGHPLSQILADLEKGPSRPTALLLKPLGHADVNRLIADALSRDDDSEIAALADHVLRQTEGNPFFIGQLLSFLHAKENIWFDAAAGRWAFDLTRIHEAGVSADVAGLLAERIKGLSTEERRVLGLASAIGNTFDLDTLAAVSGRSHHHTAEQIWSATQLDLVRPLSAAYRYVDLEAPASFNAAPGSVVFAFLHDRVQEAAYAGISGEDPRAVHLQVGRLLLGRSKEDGEARIFEVVNQLDLAIDLITDPAERLDLGRLNLDAGTRAKSSTAYTAASRYLSIGVGLLPEDAWQGHYDLAFALHRQQAEAEYLLGNHGQADALFERLMREARSRTEKSEIYRLRSSLLTNQGKYLESVTQCVEALHIVGIDVPQGPELAAATAAERARLDENLAGRSLASLADLPAVTDEDEKERHKLLSYAVIYGAYNAPELFQILSYMLVNRSLEHGHALGSSAGYATYAMLVGDHATAYELGRVALAVSERFDDLHWRSLAKFYFGAFINGWCRHVSESLPHLEQALAGCLESGSHVYASTALLQTVFYRLHRSDELRGFRLLARRNREALRTITNQSDMLYFVGAYERVAALLSGGAVAPEEKPYFDGEVIADKLGHYPAGMATLRLGDLAVSYLLGDQQRTIEALSKAEPLFMAVFGHISGEPELRFYQGLLYAELLPTAAESDAEVYRKGLAKALEQMEGWARTGPETFGHKALVLGAEAARLDGQYEKASDLFDQAIEAAAQHGFLNVQGIAGELAARLHLGRGRQRVARAYLRDARHAFARWGADAKNAQLAKRYGDLLPPAELEGGDGQSLDLATVIKASQAISGEIVLDDLLRTLMRTALENAGAQRGFLILKGGSPLYVEAGYGDAASIRVRAEAVDQREDLAHSIVRYVERTRESVVLGDASRAPQFRADPHITGQSPRSILCLPVIKQKKLVGILYLENNLTFAAFTPQQCALLDVLAAQAAISIENALLVETLEQRVRERTRELSEKNDELSRTLTHLKATQRQLVTQEKLASLGALTAGIAHELKNPLNFVNNLSETSAEITQEIDALLAARRAEVAGGAAAEVAGLIGELRENVRTIHRQGVRANDIIEGMLLHARSKPGRQERTAVNALVADSVRLACHGVRGEGHEGEIRIDEAYDPAVHEAQLDAPEIRRVLINIINNALYALREKRRASAAFAPALAVETRDRGDRVEITVRDNGPGIPGDVLPKIYNPFFTTKPTGQGAGLGLSISREIVVDGHRGDLRVESAPDEFTAFHVTLPKEAPAA